MRFLLTLLFLSCGLTIVAQRDSAMLKIVAGLDKYRTELLNKRLDDRGLLGRAIQKQQELGMSEEALANMFVGLVYIPKDSEEYRTDSTSYHAAWLRAQSVNKSMTDEEIAVIIRNRDMYDLMHAGVLSFNPPYILSPSSTIYSELKFYDIRDGDRIAEVGAGNGEFSILLGVIYDQLDIYVNEIEQDYLDYVSEKIRRIRSIRKNNTYHTMLGRHNNPNLPPAYFDKIITRGSLHHFRKRQAMLRHIAGSLAPEGEFLVFESLRTKMPGRCPLSMTHDQIIKETEKEFFTLVDMWQRENDVCYRFRKK